MILNTLRQTMVYADLTDNLDNLWLYFYIFVLLSQALAITVLSSTFSKMDTNLKY